MPRPDTRRAGGPGRAVRRAVVGGTAVAVAVGGWLVQDGLHSSHPAQPAASAARGAPTGAGGPDGPGRSQAPAAPPLPPSDPVRIRIPSIRVDAPLTGLGLDAEHRLGTPPVTNPNLVGWYREGVSPGARGNAIAVGHVDTRTGPAVFYRLGLLRTGDTIEVTRRDHRTAVFAIDAVRVFPKSSFPDAEVYGPTDRPELRVITCGGHYDRHSGYQSNTVVFSHLVATR